MEKFKYLKPETEVVKFDVEDIITTSEYDREDNLNPATAFVEI